MSYRCGTLKKSLDHIFFLSRLCHPQRKLLFCEEIRNFKFPSLKCHFLVPNCRILFHIFLLALNSYFTYVCYPLLLPPPHLPEKCQIKKNLPSLEDSIFFVFISAPLKSLHLNFTFYFLPSLPYLKAILAENLKYLCIRSFAAANQLIYKLYIQ